MGIDAIVIGSGPNGLTAAVELARAGLQVEVYEAASSIGGGTRTQALTLPGFAHDVCSAVHPTGILSPYMSRLPLDQHGLEWVASGVSAAHPLLDGTAAVLAGSVEDTAATLGKDGAAYTRLMAPFVRYGPQLLEQFLGPFRFPKPSLMLPTARFGLLGIPSAQRIAGLFYKDELAKGLFAGCAAHSILPLSWFGTGAVGLIFQLTAHLAAWPVARGGSHAITKALTSYLKSLGGVIHTDSRVHDLHELPEHRAVVFDTSARNMLEICGEALPARYRSRVSRFRYGPGVFKVDWALDGPIPWAAPGCDTASTVHVGGTLSDIARSEHAMYHGSVAEHPFLLVCQQSVLDKSRAPAGKHTGYAYCHVPAGYGHDLTERIEAQIERFAPGFRDRILARAVMTPTMLEARNANYIGGSITGGVMDLRQLFTRPVARWDPYSTPNQRIFLCSASTPPGGGVHGMCGFHAARSVLGKVFGKRDTA
ncbi:MAG: NAD(P)/FAD-dependent oxidoreductase [Myxococcota bacterium]|nr:NAD(P)/FAD-dependent oxidoreductase [Myxococcota bacterium]